MSIKKIFIGLIVILLLIGCVKDPDRISMEEAKKEAEQFLNTVFQMKAKAIVVTDYTKAKNIIDATYQTIKAGYNISMDNGIIVRYNADPEEKHTWSANVQESEIVNALQEYLSKLLSFPFEMTLTNFENNDFLYSLFLDEDEIGYQYQYKNSEVVRLFLSRKINRFEPLFSQISKTLLVSASDLPSTYQDELSKVDGSLLMFVFPEGHSYQDTKEYGIKFAEKKVIKQNSGDIIIEDLIGTKINGISIPNRFEPEEIECLKTHEWIKKHDVKAVSEEITSQSYFIDTGFFRTTIDLDQFEDGLLLEKNHEIKQLKKGSVLLTEPHIYKHQNRLVIEPDYDCYIVIVVK